MFVCLDLRICNGLRLEDHDLAYRLADECEPKGRRRCFTSTFLDLHDMMIFLLILDLMILLRTLIHQVDVVPKRPSKCLVSSSHQIRA